MSRPISATRLLLMIAAFTNPFCWFPCIAEVRSALAPMKAGMVTGTVFVVDLNGGGSPVKGAAVRLSGNSFSTGTVTDETGKYSFPAVAPAAYQIEVKAPRLAGSKTVTVVSGATVDVPIKLEVEAIRESVTVSAKEPEIPMTPSDETTINRSVTLNAPNKYERFDALLPLVPGVVRGPDGLINMKGARSTQSGALVNSANVSDPATGNVAMRLPIDVVQQVKVVSNPYDPEYGRLAGAVSSVDTTSSSFDDFHFSKQNLFPRPRKRGGDFIGVESATPRFTLTGPLVKNKIAFTESFEYRFTRTPVSSLPPLERDIKLEGFNSFIQLDVNLTQRQSLTASFALYPQKFDYVGLNTFNPQPTTPDLHQRGYMASVQHRYTTGADSLLLSQFSYKRFDADLTANSNDAYQLFIETAEGGYYNRQRRQTYRTEWQETYQFGVNDFFGRHRLKAGLNFAHSNYDARVLLLPATITGVGDVALERINFGPASRFGIHQNETALFLADKWQTRQRLSLDLGLRLDRDSLTSSTNVAPRAGFALMLTHDAKTLLKGGVGLFYDRVPLNIASFPLLPDRTVLDLTSNGQIAAAVPYVNTITGGLRNPRSLARNVELDRQITSDLTMRAGFQQRNTNHDFAINPETKEDQDHGVLSLSNSGRSLYRDYQVTGRYKIRQDTLNASCVRSKAYGDLNDSTQFFGDNGVPVINPNARAVLPFDAPNRFLFWGGDRDGRFG